jgi:hypothetical protein
MRNTWLRSKVIIILGREVKPYHERIGNPRNPSKNASNFQHTATQVIQKPTLAPPHIQKPTFRTATPNPCKTNNQPATQIFQTNNQSSAKGPVSRNEPSMK